MAKRFPITVEMDNIGVCALSDLGQTTARALHIVTLRVHPFERKVRDLDFDVRQFPQFSQLRFCRCGPQGDEENMHAAPRECARERIGISPNAANRVSRNENARAAEGRHAGTSSSNSRSARGRSSCTSLKSWNWPR